MAEIRIDVDTASRAELVAEIRRLADTCTRWADGYRDVVEGNREAWEEQTASVRLRLDIVKITADEAAAASTPDVANPDVAKGMRQVGNDIVAVLAAPDEVLPYLATIWKDTTDPGNEPTR